MNDARIMHKFELAGQTHDATLGFYVANIDQDFSRYSSTALLDVQNNSRLLDLVSVDPDRSDDHSHRSWHLPLRL